MSCASVDGNLASQAARINECREFEAARDRVRAIKHKLSNDQLETIIDVNRLAAILCTLSPGELADQLNAISDEVQ